MRRFTRGENARDAYEHLRSRLRRAGDSVRRTSS